MTHPKNNRRPQGVWICAIIILLAGLTSTPAVADEEVWENATAFCDPEVTCKKSRVKVTRARIKVRRTRFTCKREDGETRDVDMDGNIKRNEYGTFRTSQCAEAKIEVKVSVRDSGSWNKCGNWKSTKADFVSLPEWINEFDVRPEEGSGDGGNGDSSSPYFGTRFGCSDIYVEPAQ